MCVYTVKGEKVISEFIIKCILIAVFFEHVYQTISSIMHLEEHCPCPPPSPIESILSDTDLSEESSFTDSCSETESSEETYSEASGSSDGFVTGQSVAFVTYKGEVYYTQPFNHVPEPPIEESPTVEVYGVQILKALPNIPASPPSSINSSSGVSSSSSTAGSPSGQGSSSSWPPPPPTGEPIAHCSKDIDIVKNMKFSNIVSRDPPAEPLPQAEEKPLVKPIGPLTEEEILERTRELAERMVEPFL